jgi:hypothetical protein
MVATRGGGRVTRVRSGLGEPVRKGPATHPIGRRPLASLGRGERRPTGSRAAGGKPLTHEEAYVHNGSIERDDSLSDPGAPTLTFRIGVVLRKVEWDRASTGTNRRAETRIGG